MMTDLEERVVQASIFARAKAMRESGEHDYNLITAKAAIALVLEEAAKLSVSGWIPSTNEYEMTRKELYVAIRALGYDYG